MIYSYPLIAGTITFLLAIFRFRQFTANNRSCLSWQVYFPWIGNISFAFTGGGKLGIDLTPLTFILSELLFAWNIFRFQLLDLVPVVRDLVFENMGEGVLVLDPADRIVDINPAGARMLGINKAFAIGSSVKLVNKKWDGKLSLGDLKRVVMNEIRSKSSRELVWK